MMLEAEHIGIPGKVKDISVKDADIVLMDADYNVLKTYVRGV